MTNVKCQMSNEQFLPLTHIIQERKLTAIFEQFFEAQLGADRAFLSSAFRQHTPARMYNQAAAGVKQFRVVAETVDPDNVSLIFNRAGSEQCHPVLFPRHRPARDHGIEVRSAPNSRTENLGESQVIADE